jgi:hypothetical protein
MRRFALAGFADRLGRAAFVDVRSFFALRRPLALAIVTTP